MDSAHNPFVDKILELEAELHDRTEQLLETQKLLAVMIQAEGGTVEIMASAMEKLSANPKHLVRTFMDHDAGVRIELRAGHPPGSCRQCGCTDDHACEQGCYWVAPGLCSGCVDPDEDLASFVNHAAANVGLDWEKATNAAGDPIGWEGD